MENNYIEQKELIISTITKLTDELKKDDKYQEIGSSSEDSVLEFEAFESNRARAKDCLTEINKLKKALSRIEEGTYGICSECEKSIEPDRLKVYPEAEYCSSHAKKDD